MRFALTVPSALAGRPDLWLGPGTLPRLGAEVEAAGFDAIGVTDHPFPPRDWLANGGHHALDPFVSLSFLAAGTSTIRLFTNVLVLPYRDPVITAKSIATLDVLSGGRLIVGAAIGYLEPEFDVVGADFRGRAATFERTIAEMRAAWATADAAEAGPHVMYPPPVQRPHPPIWIGGNSGAARRRAARLGDGWLPFGQPAAMAEVTGSPALASTVDALATQVARFEEDCAAAGRAERPDVCFGPFGRSPLFDREAPPEDVDAEIRGYADAGVTWLGFMSRAKDPDDLRRELDRWQPILVRAHAEDSTRSSGSAR
jgi:probable F420-dependent oxidoreductase